MDKKVRKPISIRNLDAELWADFKNFIEKLSIREGKKITISEALEDAIRLYMKKKSKNS